MSSVRKIEWIGVESYLAGEEAAEVRHEYVDGAIYAMVGTTARHNLIAGNLYAALRKRLGSSECQTFIADMKVRTSDAFYYPDVVVTCTPLAPDAVYLTEPTLIVEVLSESTEGRDRLEKWTASRTLESLHEYVLVAQDRQAIDVYRRTSDGWQQITFGPDENLELESVDLHIPMADIYAS